jgi:hypothetical protein
VAIFLGFFFWFFSDLVFSKKGIYDRIFFFEGIFHKMAKMRHPKKKVNSLAATRHAFLSTMKSASFF